MSLQVKAKLQKMGAIAPMNIFLRQEIDRMQRVIRIVRNTLQDLQLAIDGTIIMSEVGSLPQTHRRRALTKINLVLLSLYRASGMRWTVSMTQRCQASGER